MEPRLKAIILTSMLYVQHAYVVCSPKFWMTKLGFSNSSDAFHKCKYFLLVSQLHPQVQKLVLSDFNLKRFE